MQKIPLEKKRAFLINLAFFLAVFGIVYFLICYALPWMMPFLFAYFVAFMAEPLVGFMTKKLHFKRGFASPVALLILFALFSWLLIVIFSRLAYETSTFLDNWSSLYALISEKLLEFGKLLETQFSLLPPYVADYVEKIVQSVIDVLPSLLGTISMPIMSALTAIAMRLPSILILSLVILASCLLFSVDFHGLRAFLQLQVPSFAQGAVAEAISFFKLTVVRFIRAYCIICLVTFFELEIGFLLIGVDYSMTLATIIALVDILPILGCGTVLIPWGIIAILFGNIRLGISLLILCAFITTVRQVLEPRVVGNTIGLHPIAALLAIYTGFNFFGIFGMFMVPILLIVLKHLQDEGYLSIWKTASTEEAPAGTQGG